MRLEVTITPSLKTEYGETELHVFFSEGISMPVHILPGDEPTRVVLEGKAKRCRADAILGIDCHACDSEARLGLDSIRLTDLKPGRTIRCTLRNPNSRSARPGKVLVKCESISGTKTVAAAGEPDIHALQDYIGAAFRPFRDGTLEASQPEIARIHAPMFMARAGTLPGQCYWMNSSWRGFDETYLEHLGGITRRRLGAGAPVDGRFLAELCIAFPSSCAYVSDFFRKGKDVYPFESFDDLFTRKQGDCEDFSRATCMIFDHVRFTQWKRPFGQELQRVAENYVAGSVLGMVSKPSFSGNHMNVSWAAHMFVLLLPQATVGRWAGLDLGGEALKTYCCEGTGHVSCDLEGNEAATEVAAELPETLDSQAFPGVKNSFYKKNVHMFTNTLFRMGRDVGHFTFMKDGRYGVPFEDVYNQSTSVSLFTHPPLSKKMRGDVATLLRQEAPVPALTVPRRRVSTAYPQSAPGVDVQGCQHKDFFKTGGTLTKAELKAVARFTEGRDTVLVEHVMEDFTSDHTCERVRVYYK